MALTWRVTRPLLAVVLGGLLSACAYFEPSPPTQFYTLTPGTAAPLPATDAPYLINVMAVDVPVGVDRPQIVIQLGDGSLRLLEYQRWIAPLADQLRTALSTALTRRLHSTDVHDTIPSGDTPVYRVHVDVQQFESVPASHTLMAATWSIHKRGDETIVQTCNSQIRETVQDTGYAALVRAHRREVQQLAAQIAPVLKALATGQKVSCPQSRAGLK